MFCASRHVFGGAEGVGSNFHILRPHTYFRRYRWCRVPFLCFALPVSFYAIPWESGPVFMFCVLVLVFSCSEGVGSCFHALRSRTCFRVMRRTSGPVFIFCAPGLIFGGSECVEFRFHALRSLDTFSVVPRASDPVFMFCAPGLIFGGAEGDGSRFHVLCSRTRFRRYRGRRVPFSCFRSRTCFRVVRRTSGPIFIFCAPGLIFGCSECVGFRFHALRSLDTFLAVPKASDPVFMFCAPRLIFGGAEGVESRFHVLHPRTRFQL
jgi:hypothetical protein